MKKKIITLILATSLAACTALTGCAKDGATENASAGSLYTSEDTTETVGGVIVLGDNDALVWNADDMDALSGIISGIGGEIDGSGGIREIRALLSYDTSIVKSISFDTSGVSFGVAGEYEVAYSILMDRDALVSWMDENDIDPDAYNIPDGTEDSKFRVSTTGVVTITSNAEGVSVEDVGESGADETADNSTDSAGATTEISGSTGSSSNSTASSSSSSYSSSSNSSGSSSSNSSSSGSSSSGSSSSSSKTSGSSGSSGSSGNSGSSSGASSASTHKHSYTSTVTKAATCGSTGVRTYTCSCGASYTETISATGAHSWVETGYYQAVTVTDTAAYDERVSVVTCNVCGKTFSSTKEWAADDCSIDHGAYTVSYKTVHHDAVTHTEQQWVSTGYKCSVCGATK